MHRYVIKEDVVTWAVLCFSSLRHVETRLKRDIPSVIQRNSWRKFFQSCFNFHLAFAYPLVITKQSCANFWSDEHFAEVILRSDDFFEQFLEKF